MLEVLDVYAENDTLIVQFRQRRGLSVPMFEGRRTPARFLEVLLTSTAGLSMCPRE